jgi:hypothetical protein
MIAQAIMIIMISKDYYYPTEIKVDPARPKRGISIASNLSLKKIRFAPS